MRRKLYEVFARKERRDALAHIGTVRAPNDDFAKVYARNTYDEENWVEVMVVPRSALITVLDLVPLIESTE